MKTILITGATGFLGKHLVAHLRQSEPEARLKILCRSELPVEQAGGIESVRGDVTSRNDVEQAARGAQQIYHLAGLVSRNPRDLEIIFRTHIEGTRNVCEAALRNNCEKVVIASSSGTIAVSREPIVHDETAAYPLEIIGFWPYYLSKVYQEKLAFDYFSRRGLPVVLINPSLLLGPGDERQSSTRDVALFLGGQILAIPRGGLNFVDARDVAVGAAAAMRQGRAGQRYLLGGVNWTFQKLIETVAQISGCRAPRLHLPVQFALWGARCLRQVYPLVGKSFKLDDTSIQMSECFWYCNSAKAEHELGFQPRDPLMTLRDTIEDLRKRPKLG